MTLDCQFKDLGNMKAGQLELGTHNLPAKISSEVSVGK